MGETKTIKRKITQHSSIPIFQLAVITAPSIFGVSGESFYLDKDADVHR
jgi:hypothetical protein